MEGSAPSRKLEEKLEELADEYSKTKYNKATDKHLGLLRAKIAKIKKEISTKRSKRGFGFSIKKEGDATVALIGLPNSGKSSILNALTNAESTVSERAFTTVDVIPGMLLYNGAKIQLLDLPGLMEDAYKGSGGSMKIMSAARNADLFLFVADATNTGPLLDLIEGMKKFGVLINETPPDIIIEKRARGGIKINSGGRLIPKEEAIRKILAEFKIFNAEVTFRSDATEDDVIYALTKNRAYVKGAVVLNKIDLVNDFEAEAERIEKRVHMEVIPISALLMKNIENLKSRLFEMLEFQRIYLKPKNGEADYEKPVIVKKGSTIIDVAKKIHTEMAKNFKYAYVSGRSAKFKNQKVGPEHVVLDGDTVTISYAKG
ncbi:MAG: GTPase [Candidatus Micrarchaeaceae archaeon]